MIFYSKQQRMLFQAIFIYLLAVMSGGLSLYVPWYIVGVLIAGLTIFGARPVSLGVFHAAGDLIIMFYSFLPLSLVAGGAILSPAGFPVLLKSTIADATLCIIVAFLIRYVFSKITRPKESLHSVRSDLVFSTFMSITLVFLLFISTHGSYQRNIFRAYGDLYGLGVQDLAILAGNPQTDVEKRIGAILLISGLSVMDDQLATRHKLLEMVEGSKDCPREVHAASKVAQTILKAVEIRGALTKGMKPWNLFPVGSRDLMAMEYYTQRIAVEILLGNTKDLETGMKF